MSRRREPKQGGEIRQMLVAAKRATTTLISISGGSILGGLVDTMHGIGQRCPEAVD